MAVIRMLSLFAGVALLVDLAMATNYTVGSPNGGWDTTTDLQTWVSSKSFVIGDNLIFVYTTQHDVLEVSKTNYESCDGSSPIQPFTDGNTVISLSNPGTRYFICGTAGHCGQGMKLQINTLSSSSSSPPPSPSPSPPIVPTPPTPQVTVPSSSPYTSPPAPPPDSNVQPPEFSPASTPPAPDFFFNPILVPVSPPPPSFGFRLNLSAGFSVMSVILIVLIL